MKGMPWLQVGVGGAEYGALRWKDGEQAPKLGDRLDIYCTNLDQSTNAFDRYYVAQGNQIVDVGPSWAAAAQPSAERECIAAASSGFPYESKTSTCFAAS